MALKVLQKEKVAHNVRGCTEVLEKEEGERLCKPKR